MTRYSVLVSERLLELRNDAGWLPVEGFRLLSVGEPQFPGAPVRVCEFEDDGAPPELEGKLVDPQVSIVDGVRRVTGRSLVTDAPA